ncbi:T9SS type A sorting domain-containing protein [Flavobacterium sp. LS1R49]|uniref:T9SS type A sorting domain-containing protein n=1 Tax=Flavobacterium shii TaxID=2987687 RepID=A0A9X2ZDZ0_9FLAO|nr:T9SS type A sorting domain-containing protein [Flavobacterium shii]MCV9928012.1 T9SS type A sorting domain-containing protein [Flavobacterium shii]
MKKILLYMTILLVSVQVWAQQVQINEVAGWLESAYVKWQPVANAQSYNVYYTGGGITDKKIDNELIRSYGTYYRADIPGIKAGSYTIKIKPVISGVEGTGSTTSSITVKAHDRAGFAFANNRVPGAYNADGTPKTNAVIIYITENTKNTVSLAVTGATPSPSVGLQTILDGYKKGKDLRPLIVRMIGQITDLSYMLSGDIVVENNNNAASYITIEGIGDDAVADGWGIRVKNASNIEIRNIGTMNCDSSEGDNIGLQQDNDYIWVHNCDFFYGNAGSDADQIKGDGALDCKKSTYITFSYNHFWDSGKSNLLGLSENTTTGLYITYHHNWYDHSDSRHPRVRFYSAHVYNNYYDGNAKYGIGSTMSSSVFVENNFFRNCKYPMLTSMQGTDVYNGALGTFSKEDGGTIKAYNNTMSGETRFIPYNATNYPIEFDAYVATTRNETVSSSIVAKKGGKAYNNFDTDSSIMYAYTPDSPEVAKTNVMQYAGRVTGGDLKWTFNNAVDDASSLVNDALKAALVGYKTKLAAIQGETGTTVSTQTLTSTNNNDQTVTNGTAISTIIFTWGGDATDVTVTGLPTSGITFVKNTATKTITISGSPTATVPYSIATSGVTGTATNATGTITALTNGSTPGNQTHNFTTDAKTSTFYTITGNINSTAGSITYSGLTLTARLKMESSTTITYTTTSESTLTLVFDDGFAGKVKVNGVSYTASAGIVTVSLPAGNNTIIKGDTTNLYYISTEYKTTLRVDDNILVAKLILYPNPVTNYLRIANSDQNIEKVTIYSMTGALVKTTEKGVEIIDMSKLSPGNYLVKVQTTEGAVSSQIIIKK